MTTLVDRIASASASSDRSITFITAAGADAEIHDRVTWAQLWADSGRVASALAARGIGPGDHVALLAPTSRALVTTIQAVWRRGAAVVVLPLPLRLASIDAFAEQTAIRIRNSEAALLVADPELAAFLPAVDVEQVALAKLVQEQHDSDPPPAPITSDHLAVLQFTSGSTSEPKGVMITHANMVANLDAAAIAAELDATSDVFVSWLPLYHDMGLIGALTIPMMSGTEMVLGAPQDFMAKPARWMQWMHQFGGTATAGPNFSYALAARALRRADTLDLSRWRIALNGAEPVDAATVSEFIAAGQPHGLDARCVFPAFGMAEVTIAGTFPVAFGGAQFDTVDRSILERERYAAPTDANAAHAKTFARLGRPVPGLELRITEPESDTVLGEREVGEVELRGPSVTQGYFRNPGATAAVMHDGWFRTGDLGYLVDGELVLCGRIKDVIIIGGRNVFPEDVERAATSVDGVRAGNVMAFATEGRKGKEQLVVVAETKLDDTGDLHDQVVDAVCDAIGIPPHDVVFVQPGTLPKTSSGKLQRSLCRQRYLESELVLVAV